MKSISYALPSLLIICSMPVYAGVQSYSLNFADTFTGLELPDWIESIESAATLTQTDIDLGQDDFVSIKLISDLVPEAVGADETLVSIQKSLVEFIYI